MIDIDAMKRVIEANAAMSRMISVILLSYSVYVFILFFYCSIVNDNLWHFLGVSGLS